MSKKGVRVFCMTLCITLDMALLLWVFGPATAQGPDPSAPEQQVGAERGAVAAGRVGSRINYQGVVKQDGLPVTGSRDMTFRLYSDASCTTQVGGSIYRSGVQIADGLFRVDLDVYHGDFDGRELWLEVEVAGTRIGCQEVLPVPYALSLRPGAEVVGSVASPSAALMATSYGTGFGIYGYGDDIGIYGRGNTGVKAWGMHYGIYGSSGQTGIYGEGSVGYGVYGTTRDIYPGVSGVGGYGKGSAPGLYGMSQTGPGVRATSESGNLIEASKGSPFTGWDHKFRVANDGQVYADGSFHPGGADMAEMLPAKEGLEPGDVLAVDVDGQLVRSSEPYQSTVVGVYSTKPGFLGGAGEDEDLAGKVPLAVVGVVPVKASTENGAIHPGDLLVAGSVPGHVMRSGPNPPVGTVVGKALSGLDEDVGVIQMLATLQ